MFNIENRRYVGNKYKLMKWIKEEIDRNCKCCESFFDVFAGTGAVSGYLIDNYKTIMLNDFLYSNEIIFKGFFMPTNYDNSKLEKIKQEYKNINIDSIEDNYVSKNYGDKFFSNDDAKKIGYIREDIEKKYLANEINEKEYCILISSLIYSFDRISNTVGHYEAYIKGKDIRNGQFKFELINPIDTSKKEISIYRKDANELVKEITTDIAFIDPPYNSRQYSRFYHVLETITKWDKPELYGTAMKPKEENMSDYCRVSAPTAFDNLIQNINAKYIVVTYNNTYNSKSSSSRNKITLEQITNSLNKKGKTTRFEMPYKFFNAGKTNLEEHKEILFITEVKNG